MTAGAVRLTRTAAGLYHVDDTFAVERHANGWRWFVLGEPGTGGEWRRTRREAVLDLDDYLRACSVCHRRVAGLTDMGRNGALVCPACDAAAEAAREAATPRASAVPPCPACGSATFLDPQAGVGDECRPAVVRFCAGCEWCKEVTL